MRYLFGFTLLLAGCWNNLHLSHPPLAGLPSWYRDPPTGCVQSDYRHLRRSTYLWSALYRNGKPAADESGSQQALMALTREDPEAHALARQSLHYTHLDQGLMTSGMLAMFGGMLAAIVPLTPVNSDDRVSKIGLGVGLPVMGLGIGMILLDIIPLRRAVASFERATAVYNTHVTACADPESPLASTRRMREEAVQRAVE